jgi:glutamate-5-semialdehyde dehydrogenase
MTKSEEIRKICKKVKEASFDIANLSSEIKNKILAKIAQKIRAQKNEIIAANKIDLENGEKNNIGNAKLDRLKLDENRIEAIAKSIDEIILLEDPVGKITYDVKRDNNLHIRRITTPIGVLLAIYESRPNVTSDIAALALKSGNCSILRSGSESYNSSKIIAKIYTDILQEFKINENAVHYVDSTDREYVQHLLQMDDLIDVVIPRGGKDLIQAISNNTKIAIFKHLDGNCHSYVHESADLSKARTIIKNAKMRRVGICGATESLVIDEIIANKFLPLIVDDLADLGCEIRGDEKSVKIDKRINQANKDDFYTEYLDKIISVKIVKNIDEAIAHINEHGSSHTEAIITEDQNSAQKFFDKIHSAIVMHNASTQFADGGEFGLGAEVGISTGKLHARGPVGLEQLVTYKYLIQSDLAIRKV